MGKFREVLPYETAESVVNLIVDDTFASGTTKVTDDGFDDAKVGTIIIASSSGYLVTAINDSTGVITAKKITA